MAKRDKHMIMTDKLIFTIASFYFLICPYLSFANDEFEFKPSEITNELLVDILNNSERQVPDIPSDHQWPSSKNHVMTPFIVKLYSIPMQGDCIPETHMICSHRYYLAIGDYGEEPLQAVFYLGNFGEITKFKWVTTPVRMASIDIEIQNYPTYAFKRNRELKKKTHFYRIRLYIEKDIKLEAVKK